MVLMTVLKPVSIIGREPCPRLHLCPSLPSPSTWAGWSYRIRWCSLAPALSTALGGVVDARKARGIRHRLVVLLTVTVCAVAARVRSFVAVAEWVADLPESLADTLGTSQRCPSESTIRRAVGAMDADAFDAVIGGFIQQLCTAVPVKGRRRVLAVDGKALGGSRHSDRDGHPSSAGSPSCLPSPHPLSSSGADVTLCWPPTRPTRRSISCPMGGCRCSRTAGTCRTSSAPTGSPPCSHHWLTEQHDRPRRRRAIRRRPDRRGLRPPTVPDRRRRPATQPGARRNDRGTPRPRTDDPPAPRTRVGVQQ